MWLEHLHHWELFRNAKFQATLPPTETEPAFLTRSPGDSHTEWMWEALFYGRGNKWSWLGPTDNSVPTNGYQRDHCYWILWSFLRGQEFHIFIWNLIFKCWLDFFFFPTLRAKQSILVTVFKSAILPHWTPDTSLYQLESTWFRVIGSSGFIMTAIHFSFN